MNNFCTACGARLERGVRICPNCGKLIPLPKEERHPQRASNGRQHKRPSGERPQKNIRRPQPEERRPRPAKPAEERAPVRQSAERPKGRKRLVKRLIAAAVIVTVLYFAVFGLQVLRIRHSSYDFDTDMKLSCQNFGEAFDRSVEDGKWSYNPFTFTAEYSGKHDGKDITVSFSAFVDVKVKSVEVAGEKKDTDKQKNIYLMGLFI